MGDIKVYKIRNMEGGAAIDLIERHESWVPGGVASDLYDALDELADLMQGVIEGDYKPDSLTLQVARAALAKARGVA